MIEDSARNVPVLRVSHDGIDPQDRSLPVEAPVAVEFGGIAYAVMMATPHDLEDFAYGFALSERIIDAPDEIRSVDAVSTPDGWRLNIQLSTDRMARVTARVRNRVAEGSCGICGLESLADVNRPLPLIKGGIDTTPPALFSALEALSAHQPLGGLTGGAHAAAFCAPSTGALITVREDVGRHNALDKLIGALARTSQPTVDGFFLVTARCSQELVDKTAIAGCPMLVAISTATTMAVKRAEACGLGLVALARSDSMLALTTPAKNLLRKAD